LGVDVSTVRHPTTASWFARSLPVDQSAPSAARRFTHELLQCYELNGLADTVQLLVSELVSNVVRHAEAPLVVRIACDHDIIRVEVDDGSALWPVIVPSRSLGEAGRGLGIVDGVASRWGVDRRPGGKSVWFELDVLAPLDR